MRKFYTITLITFLVLLVSVRGFVSYYHISSIFDISHGISHVYADDGGDGGDGGGDGGDGDGDGGGSGGDGGDGGDGDGGGSGGDGGGDGDGDGGGSGGDGGGDGDGDGGDGGGDGGDGGGSGGDGGGCDDCGGGGPSLVTIVATKIVCENESDLPNWSGSSVHINSNTASNFLSNHSDCHLEPNWQFQWGTSSVTDPGGSFVGVAQNPWTTFSSSTNVFGETSVTIPVPSDNFVWIREVLKSGYQVFTGETGNLPGSNVSAEMYCNRDVLNYDNFDYINNIVAGQTYYCVAFNVSTDMTPVNHPPVITLIGSNPATTTVDAMFTDPGATATDQEDGNLTSFIVASSTVNTTIVGTYAIVYSVIDSGGLSASVTRQVIVSEGNGGGGTSTSTNLSVSKTSDKTTANVSDTVTYTLTLTNGGPDNATGVTVTDILHAGLNFVSATSTTGSYATTTGIWTVGNLTNGSSTILTLVVTVRTGFQGQVIPNTATTTGIQTDPTLGNNTSTVNITVSDPCTVNCDGGSLSANLTVTKTSDKSTANVSDTVTYTVTLTNNGPNNATGVSLTDTIPSGLNFVSASSTLGSYSTTTGIWTVGNLTNGSSTVLTLITTINSGNEGVTIVNTAVASGTQTDPTPTDNTSSVNVVVNSAPACTTNCGGGGGGGGSSSGSGGGSSSGGSSRPTTTVTVTDTACFYLRDYMRRDFDNDPIEVLKLQAFLRNFEGHNNVSLTGVFDQATFDAVSAFQMKYFSDILEPWGHTGPTGYVYILTLKKINEIYCQRIFPLNQAQLNEIVAFRALLESLRARGIDVELPPSESGRGGGTDTSTTTLPIVPIVGELNPPQGQNLRNLAAAIFALPETLLDTVKCLYEFLLILIILYILGNVLKDVLYKNVLENALKRFVVKWLTIDVGIVVVLVVAYIMGWWCLVLPLLIALVIALAWTLSYSKHNSMRASVKSWYLVSAARAKSIFKNIEGKPARPDARLNDKVGQDSGHSGGEEKKEFKEKETVIILPKLIPKEKEDIKPVVAESKK
ncbi:MAG: DUF5011 domain-containing protein [bacterium]|nr:DUF5011 domain-containing protein [bacterium]